MSALMIAAALLGGQGVADGNQPERCIFDVDRGAMIVTIGLGEIAVAPGETVRIRPQWTPFPQSFYPVAHRCLSGWRVSDPRLATLSRDRRSLVIGRRAPAGTVVTLTARYRGETLTQNFRVIAPIVSPLVGGWRQRAEDCPGDTWVFGLGLDRDGSFSVTFGWPMHSNVDYRGRWRADGDRLILSDLAASSGQIPADAVREARFTIDEVGGLRFDPSWYGTAGARGTCRAPFIRNQ